MINSSGFLKRTLLLFSSFCLSFLFLSTLPKHFVSASDIKTQLTAHYTLNSDGDLTSSLNFTLSNTSIIPSVVNYYTVTLPFTNIDDLVVITSGKEVPRTIHKQSTGSDVVINFENLVVPRGGSVNFTATFKKNGYVEVDGIASLSFPAEFVGIDDVGIVVDYPLDWAAPSWVSTPAYEHSNSDSSHRITSTSVESKSLNILLGSGVSYTFEISKHLINSDNQTKIIDLSVPTWSSNQQITFQEVSPLPSSVVKDEEGNLTLKYVLEAEESVLAKVKGHVFLNTQRSDDLSVEELEHSLKNIEYWKLDNDTEYKRVSLYQQNNGLRIEPEQGAFTDLADSAQRSLFINNSYNYVMDRLSTDSLLNSSLESSLRAGVSVALTKRSYAVPEDYADLLISILRYFGVPSRMVIGYVTQESGYRSSGFFHSWVEYWDIDEKEWIILDPSLDDLIEENLLEMDLMERISFIIRSRSSTLPKLTYFSSEEFIVKPSASIIEPHTASKVDFLVQDSDIAKRYVSGVLEIENTGNTAFAVSGIRLLKEDENLTFSSIFNYENQVVLPGMTLSIPSVIEGIESLNNMEESISIEYRTTPPNFSPTTELSSLTISFEKKWWWDWMIRLISTIIFLGAAWLAYFTYKRIRKLWM